VQPLVAQISGILAGVAEQIEQVKTTVVMSPKGYSEDQLVEQPAIELFGELGWATVWAGEEAFGSAEPSESVKKSFTKARQTHVGMRSFFHERTILVVCIAA
jgi:hypothetical protein